MPKVEFRDGYRDVPEHVGALLKGIETSRYTYDEAMGAANRRMESDFIERGVTRIRSEHFRDHGMTRS